MPNLSCKHCHHPIPSDSSFCPFCGKAVKVSKAYDTYTVVPMPDHAFCHRCGKPVDEETKRCTGCGKQYFRGISPPVFLCLVLGLVAAALCLTCVIQAVCYGERIRELEQLLGVIAL